MKEFYKKPKKNAFLFLFFIGILIYIYADITNNSEIKYFAKFLVAPVILAHYLINSKRKNIFYLIALSFAFTGDLLFSADTRTANIMAIGCFIVYNLLLTLIMFELFGMIDLKKVITAISVTIISICVFIYFMFNSIGTDIIMLWLYFFAFSILLAFCIFYFFKFKTRESLYFLTATLLFFIANLTKTIQYLESLGSLLKLLNITSYTVSFYFYCKAIMIAEENPEPYKNSEIEEFS